MVATGVLFAPALDYPLVWDDRALVAENPYIGHTEHLGRALRSDFWELTATPHRSGMYRPLVTATYFLHGPASWPAHAFNLLTHLLCVGLVGWLARRLGASWPVAGAAAAAFGLHPAMVEAVANVAGRTDLLATTGVLVAAHLRLGPARPLAELTAGIAVLLALLCKEQAVMAVPLLLLPDIARSGVSWSLLRRARGPLLATAVYFGLRTWALGTPLPVGLPPTADAAPWSIWDGAVRTWRYGMAALDPTHLAPYTFVPVPSAALGVAALLGLLGSLWLLWRRGPRDLALAATWFALALVPTARWLPFRARFSGLLLYLPLVGVAVFGARLAGGRRVAAWMLLALAVAYASLSALRLPAWSGELPLWRDAVARAPEEPQHHLNLAVALQEAGEPLEALEPLAAARTLTAARGDTALMARVHFAAGGVYRDLGDDTAALGAFSQAWAASGQRLARAAAALAHLEMGLGRAAEAERYAHAALALDPTDAETANVAGIAAARRGDPAAAERWFRRALALRPGDRAFRRNLESLRGARDSPPRRPGAQPSPATR